MSTTAGHAPRKIMQQATMHQHQEELNKPGPLLSHGTQWLQRGGIKQMFGGSKQATEEEEEEPEDSTSQNPLASLFGGAKKAKVGLGISSWLPSRVSQAPACFLLYRTKPVTACVEEACVVRMPAIVIEVHHAAKAAELEEASSAGFLVMLRSLLSAA